MKLTPLEYLRRSEEVDDLCTESERSLTSESVAKAKEMLVKLQAMLHRLENDLP